jgi:HEAT repeat protein
LVMIDGYDDLSEGERAEKLVWLQAFMANYAGNFIIVTGPVHGYDPLVNLGLTPIYMRAWSDQSNEEAAGRWAANWPTIGKDGRRAAALPEEKLSRRVATALRGRRPLDIAMKAWAAFSNDEKEPGRRGWYDSYVRRMADSSLRQPLEKLAVAYLEGGLAPISRQALNGMFTTAENKPDEGLVGKLVGSPLTHVLPDGAIAFRHLHIAAFLAGETLTEQRAVEMANQPAWNLAYPFAGGKISLLEAAKTRLNAPSDMLHAHIFDVATWLIDVPSSATWKVEVFKRLLVALTGPSQYPLIRERAMAAIVASHDKGTLFVFRAALDSPLPLVRRLACIGLGALGETDAIKDLASKLGDPDQSVQVVAGLALAAIGSDTALERMVEGLLNGDQGLQRAVAEAMAAIPGVGHATLRDAINDNSLYLRRAAVFGLSRIRSAWSLALLYRALLEDSEFMVRSAAEDAFKQVDGLEREGVRKHPEADALEWLTQWAAARGEGVPVGLGARQVLLQVVENGQPAERIAAALTLAQLGHMPALKALYKTLGDRDEAVRASAHQALGVLQSRTGRLLPALDDPLLRVN